tara:strand:- start:175 stop:702 length:528 start_codon:yes stop_codon:yes gene_type:complete
MMNRFAICSHTDTYKGQRNRKFQKHGFGMCIYVNNIQYSGYWKNHKKHGKGIIHWEDGSYYRGTWENDICVGKGHFYNAEDNTNTYGEWDKKTNCFLKRSQRHIYKDLPNIENIIYPCKLKLPRPNIYKFDIKDIIVKPVEEKKNESNKYMATSFKVKTSIVCGTIILLCIHAFR